MTISATYDVVPLIDFERSAKRHLKSLHKRDAEAARSIFFNLSELLANTPYLMRGQGLTWLEQLKPEKWPGGTLAAVKNGLASLEGWQFWKAYLILPYAKGAAQRGRVMYGVNEPERVVYLLYFYTHAEYQGRPDDGFLEDILKDGGIPPRQQ